MTKAASRGAVKAGHPVTIAFDEKGFGLTTGDTAAGHCSIPKGMKVKYQRWNGGRKWLDTKGLNWMFFSSGLSDALRFRFEDSDQIVEIAFNPLTGTKTEELILQR